MVSSLLSKVFGSRNDRILKRLSKLVNRINALEPEVQSLSDEQLAAKTDEFRRRYQDGETLDQLLPEAFAVVREGSQRVQISMYMFPWTSDSAGCGRPDRR